MLPSPLWLLLPVLASGAAAVACTRPAASDVDVRAGVVFDASEVITGRAHTGRNIVLVSIDGALVWIDPATRAWGKSAIAPASREEYWGLAADAEEYAWTLRGRSTLVRIARDGVVAREVSLDEPHVGLFSGGDGLIYQTLQTEPDLPVLQTGPPGALARRPWSTMRTRTSPLGRGPTLALNLVMCGISGSADVPCWFPDQASLALTNPDGHTRVLPLAGLTPEPPERLLTAEFPRRPVRDAHVDDEGGVWVLASPEPLGAARAAGSLLLRHSPDGELVGRIPLAVPARLILHVRGGRCLLLSHDGRLFEVTS